MHIQLETADINTIRAYSDTQITVDGRVYKDSVIISREALVSPWPIHSIDELTESNIKLLLQFEPEVIIIGHQQQGVRIPMPVLHHLSKQRVGIECMSIGAAARTFNVLLSELRHVVAGIIF